MLLDGLATRETFLPFDSWCLRVAWTFLRDVCCGFHQGAQPKGKQGSVYNLDPFGWKEVSSCVWIFCFVLQAPVWLEKV